MRSDTLNLETPVIPAADKEGVLPPEFHNQPLTLAFKCWEGVRTGYRYSWSWNGDLELSNFKTITADDKPGDILTLEIPASQLVSGTHKVGYFTHNPTSEIINYSPTIELTIRR